LYTIRTIGDSLVSGLPFGLVFLSDPFRNYDGPQELLDADVSRSRALVKFSKNPLIESYHELMQQSAPESIICPLVSTRRV
jgi:hypothetical protein